MRVATISIYKQATYQLGRLTSDLNEANEVVSTNLKISSASDDPSGMKQVLTINSDLAALDQYQVNVDQAQNVLTTAETSLDSMADQLSEMKVLCSALSNASASYQERSNAAESMQVYLDGLMDLANTDAYGGYVFGGDDNRTTPFTYDDDNHPTSVTYNGSSDPVNISTSRNTTISLDCCGSDLFYEDKITVNATNNKIVFTEDPGTDDDNIITREATIISGTYSKEELAAAVEDSLNEASEDIVYEVGYDGDTNTFSIGTDGSRDTPLSVTFEVIQTETVRISNLKTDGANFEDVEISIVNETAVTEYTPVPEGTKPLTFTYTVDGTWDVSNDPGYGLPSEIDASVESIEIDVNDDGGTDIVINLNGEPEVGDTVSFDIVEGYENASILPDLGFESETVILETVTSDVPVDNPFLVYIDPSDPEKKNIIDFTETLLDGGGTSVQLTAEIEAGTYSAPESYAEAVEKALETASAENGNRVNYSVSVAYDEDANVSFTISEDTDTGRQLESFDLLFSSGTNAESRSAAGDLGFNAEDVSSKPLEGEEATWSVWDTVFNLKDALENDDVDGIQRAMNWLDNHYESLTSSMSTVGRIYSSTATTETTISDSI